MRAYSAGWRIAAGALVAVSRLTPPATALLLVASEEGIAPLVLLELLLAMSALPALAAWSIERAFAASSELRDRELIVAGRDLRLEIPCDSIERILPWRLPLPGPGLSLRLRSGARLRFGLQADDPAALLASLADAGGVEAARAAAQHPAVEYARARQGYARGLLHHPGVKFVAFALLPAAVMFNAHQHIAYGGTLGQYHLEGLRRYLETFGFYWGTVAIYLLLYASLWRALAEGAALAVAWAAPSRAQAARRGLEIACLAVVYAGVPLLVLLRFMA